MPSPDDPIELLDDENRVEPKRLRLDHHISPEYPGRLLGNSQISYERQRFNSQMEAERLEWGQKLNKANTKAEQALAALEAVKKENVALEAENEDLREEQNKKEMEFLKERQELKSELHRLTKKQRSFELQVTENQSELEKTIKEQEVEINQLRAQHVLHVREMAAADQELTRMQAEECGRQHSPIDADRLQLEASECRRMLAEAQEELEKLRRNGGLELPRLSMNESNQAVRMEDPKQSFETEELRSKVYEAEQKATRVEEELLRTRARVEELVAAEAQRDALLAEQQSYQELFVDILKEYSKTRLSAKSIPGKSPLKADSFASEKGQTGTPSDMVKLLRKLQSDLVFQEREFQVQFSKLEQAQTKVSTQSARIRDLEGELKGTKEAMAAQTVKVESINRSKELFVKQQQSMMDIIRTVTNQTNSEHAGSNEGEIAAFRGKLDALIETVKGTVAEIQTTQTEQKAENQSESNGRFQVLEREHNKLKKLLQQSEEREAKLANMVNSGEFNPATTKVLHLRSNPAKIAHKQLLESLRDENSALKLELESIKQNENSNVATPGIGLSRAVSYASTAKKVDQENAPAAAVAKVDPQKSYERLKVLFREKTKAFREAVYLLTGFKVDMTQDSNPRLRLRSMFAERQDDFLLFQMNAENGLEMLETDYCKRIDSNIFAYLNKCNSIPAFLSTLTLELFERQTFTMQ